MSVVGCTGRVTGWSQHLCGMLVEHEDSDFVTGISIADSSSEYPRTLVPETQVNGKTELSITCSDVSDCTKKCTYFAENSRDNGLPSPEACALCNPPCPDNLATTATDLSIAIQADIVSAMRLAAICVNPTACVCQTLMMLRPAWLDNLQRPAEKCTSASDVMSLIMDRIMVEQIKIVEHMQNKAIVDINHVIKWMGGKVPFQCLPYKNYKRCPDDADGLAALFGCQPDNDELHRRCYYECAAPCRIQRPQDIPVALSLSFQASEVNLHGQVQPLWGVSRPLSLSDGQRPREGVQRNRWRLVREPRAVAYGGLQKSRHDRIGLQRCGAEYM